MNRNYLLKVIEKNFFVLDKDELSREIADNPFFDQSLKNLVVEQSISLNDKEMFATHHSQFYETIKERFESLAIIIMIMNRKNWLMLHCLLFPFTTIIRQFVLLQQCMDFSET